MLDPVSGKIMIAGYNPQAGPGNIWLYDPTNDTFTTGPAFPPEVGYAHDFIYFPPDDSFYVLQTDGRVWRVVLNRQNGERLAATCLLRGQGGEQRADKGGARRCLGAHAHKGRHGRRRALVDIGRPHVERNQADFKAKADQ